MPGGNNNLLSLVRGLEGSGATAVSPAGARGTYQIMPGTARQYGGDPAKLFDPAYNEALAKVILEDLRSKNNTLAEVLVAYNAGQRTAERFRAAGDNTGILPMETQKYLQHAERMGANLRANVSITLENKTGSSAVFAAKQAGIAWSPGVGQ